MKTRPIARKLGGPEEFPEDQALEILAAKAEQTPVTKLAQLIVDTNRVSVPVN